MRRTAALSATFQGLSWGSDGSSKCNVSSSGDGNDIRNINNRNNKNNNRCRSFEHDGSIGCRSSDDRADYSCNRNTNCNDNNCNNESNTNTNAYKYNTDDYDDDCDDPSGITCTILRNQLRLR
jgi:hypothetical protein